MADAHLQASTREQSARFDPTESVANEVANRPFYAAVADLLPSPIVRRDLCALFDFRASYGAIQGWRFGRRSPPQWAIDLLRAKGKSAVRQRWNNLARLDQARTTLTRQEVAPINARRQKEKARQQGGP
jgi:hypothetical protein